MNGSGRRETVGATKGKERSAGLGKKTRKKIQFLHMNSWPARAEK
jgi:hypothetical protein